MMARQPGIRDQLERGVWDRYPGFARRHARREAPPRRRLAWQDRALLVLASLLVLLLIVRIETAHAEDGAWGIEVLGGSSAVRSLALNTHIDVDVSGLAARVVVSQRFRNDGARWKEAIYRYPLPPGAAVDRLRIEAGGRLIEGEIREQEAARRRYREARQSGKLASLVEQQRPNQFETRLANIGPGEEVRVEIGFLAAVEFREGSFSLALPMTFTPRYDPPAVVGANLVRDSDNPTITASAVANKVRSYGSAPRPILETARDGYWLTLDLLLHSTLDLASVESRFHDVDIQPVSGGYRVRLVDPAARSDRLFELSWTPDFGTEPASSVMTWDAGDSVYALVMLAPPLASALEPRAREVVFVIDTSGSMEGESLRQAKAALAEGLDHLAPGDRFNLVRFSTDADLLFDESVPAYPSYLDEARTYIGRLDADGGTNMAPALSLAMGLPIQEDLLRQIVFVTDGSVGNESELLLQVAEHLGDSRLFTVSIGAAPNRWFMRKAAAIGRGSHSHIGRQDEVAEQMSSLWSRIQQPAVQNLCVDWGMDAEFYPELIPDLYAGEPLWLYARLPRQPGAIVICGELDGRYWETASLANPVEGGPDLGALWARSKIEALEDSRIFGTDPAAIREAVLELALDFDLLTPYTSLVAVDRTPARPAATVLTAEDVPSLLPASGPAVAGFAPTATGWPLRLGLSLFSLFLATAMLFYSAPSRRAREATDGQRGGSRRPEAALPLPHSL